MSFFAFVENVFSHPDNAATYITYSQGTQSTIKNVYTQCRMMKRDTATTFIKGMQAQAFTKSTKAVNSQVKKGGSYPTADEEQESAALGDIFGRQEGERESTVVRWQGNLHCDEECNVPQFPYLDIDAYHELLYIKKLVLEVVEMSPDVLTGHFAIALLNDKDSSFREMAKLSTLGPLVHWFHTLFKLTAKETKQFNAYCQELNLCILQCYNRMTRYQTNKEVRKVVKYHLKIYRFMTSSSFGTLVQDIPILSLCDCREVAVLFQELSSRFLGNLHSGMNEHSLCYRKRNELPPVQRDVNQFVGWGIKSLITSLERQVSEYVLCKDNSKQVRVEAEIDLLKSM
jgi:hypothetical protein